MCTRLAAAQKAVLKLVLFSFFIDLVNHYDGLVQMIRRKEILEKLIHIKKMKLCGWSIAWGINFKCNA